MEQYHDTDALKVAVEKLSERVSTLIEHHNTHHKEMMTIMKQLTAQKDLYTNVLKKITDDELYKRTVGMVKKAGTVSSDFLQRRFNGSSTYQTDSIDQAEDDQTVERTKGSKTIKVVHKD
jgi:hypothetical protein